MKYQIKEKILPYETRPCLTIQFELSSDEFQQLTKNMSPEDYTQIQPASWQITFFTKKYVTMLQGAVVNKDVNPYEVDKELVLLEETGIINKDERNTILTKFIKAFCDKHTYINQSQMMASFGAGNISNTYSKSV